MRSHHSPPKRLLEQFTSKDRVSRSGRVLHIYEKGQAYRTSSDLRSECAENSYFAGASSGEAEDKIDFRFASEYEAQFNRILPALASDLHIFDSPEIRRVCARYVAHLFHRSRALKLATEKLYAETLRQYSAIPSDPLKLRIFAAEISLAKRGPVNIQEAKEALQKCVDVALTPEGKQARFVDDLDRSTQQRASQLAELRWCVLTTSKDQELYISDTPVLSKSEDPVRGTLYGVGVFHVLAEWFLPISPRHVLRVGHKLRSTRLITSSEAANLNHGQILTMSRRIYGRSWSPWVNDLVQRCGGDYKFFEQLFMTKAGHQQQPQQM